MKPLYGGLFGAMCLSAILFASAQDSSLVRVALNIRAQPLSSAVNEFASQTGLQVLVSNEDVTLQQRIAPAVIGTFTKEAGLAKLLQDSGLSYRFVNERTVAIRLESVPPVKAGGPVAEAQATSDLLAEDSAPAR